MTKADDQVWARAQDSLTLMLGFRVIAEPGKTPEAYQLQTWAPSEKPDDNGKLVIKSVRPTEQQMWLVWCEAVRFRVEHDAACKLAWDLYSAATGELVENFNGMPAGGPVEAVRAERERLLGERRGRDEAQIEHVGTLGCDPYDPLHG